MGEYGWDQHETRPTGPAAGSNNPPATRTPRRDRYMSPKDVNSGYAEDLSAMLDRSLNMSPGAPGGPREDPGLSPGVPNGLSYAGGPVQTQAPAPTSGASLSPRSPRSPQGYSTLDPRYQRQVHLQAEERRRQLEQEQLDEQIRMERIRQDRRMQQELQLEQERLVAERIAAAAAEHKRLQQIYLEEDRQARHELEKQRLEQERVEKERLDLERLQYEQQLQAEREAEVQREQLESKRLAQAHQQAADIARNAGQLISDSQEQQRENRRAQNQAEQERQARSEAEVVAHRQMAQQAQQQVQAQAAQREIKARQSAEELGVEAATSVRHTTDAQGNMTTQVIRKGVEDFEFKDELGTGSYSTVVAASDKQTLRQYAIKVLDKAHIIREDKVKYVEIEKLTLNRLGDHPGIIHLYFTFQDRSSLYFVLDFAPNGELLHLIKKIGSLNEECARYYACQLLDAIDFMHSKGVIHRDLKPENILLDYKMRIKITDFGTAKLMNSTGEDKYPQDVRASSFVGTAEYVTPELLSLKYQGKSTDIWAFGCVLYQMIAAAPPFQGATQFLTFQKIVNYQYSIPPGFPWLVRDLLKNVLVDHRRRWNITTIKEHAFFEGVEWSRKALWGTPPPRLQPYRPSSASMRPRQTSGTNAAGSSAHKTANTRRVPPQTSSAPKHVPTAAGLQPVNPTTRAGMPQRLAQPQAPPQSQRATPQMAQPKIRVKHHTTTSQSAAAAALYSKKSEPSPSPTSSSQTTSPQQQPQQPSGAYLQGQERANAILRRVQEQRMDGRSLQNVVPPLGSRRPNSPPVSPVINSMGHLVQPPLSIVEREWVSLLISSTERILKIGRVYAHIGPNPSGDGNAADDGLLSRLFAHRRKERILLVTTAGRLLLSGNDRKLKLEVPLGVPQVVVREVMPGNGAPPGEGPSLVIETYNRALTLYDPSPEATSSWLAAIDLSRRYYAQATAEANQNMFSAAAAAAVAVSGRR